MSKITFDSVQFLVFSSQAVVTTELVPSHKMDRNHEEVQEKGSCQKSKYKKRSYPVMVEFSGLILQVSINK